MLKDEAFSVQAHRFIKQIRGLRGVSILLADSGAPSTALDWQVPQSTQSKQVTRMGAELKAFKNPGSPLGRHSSDYGGAKLISQAQKKDIF